MKTVALRLVCVLFCVAFAYAEIMPMDHFDLEKMSGKWYLVGFATNAHWFHKHKSTMKMGTSMMTPTEEGDLHVSYANLKDDGSCWRMTHLAKKTETPGRFVFHSHHWGNENDLRIVDAKYDEYAMTHTIKTKDGVTDVLNKLHSRTPHVSHHLKKKFIQFCHDTGIHDENIVMLPSNGECSHQ